MTREANAGKAGVMHLRTDEMRPADNVLAATGFLQGLAAEPYLADSKSK